MAFTKDELLAKGIDPVVADEIIAGFSASGNDSPLLALQKAVEKKGASKGSKEAEDLLLKAEQDKEAEEKEKKAANLKKKAKKKKHT